MSAPVSSRPGAPLVPPTTAKAESRRVRLVWWGAYVFVGSLSLLAASPSTLGSPNAFGGIGLLLLALLMGVWAVRPLAALAITLGLALTGDIATAKWFPFNKNLSSRESIMWINDAVIVSPLEIVLVWGLAVVGYRNLATGRSVFRSAPLVRPLGVLFVVVVLGLMYGLSRGGDPRIALIEARPLLYLPLLYLLVVNVCSSIRDYRAVFVAAVLGITVQTVITIDHYLQLDPDTRATLESLNEHGSAISMNLVFVLTIVAFLFEGVPRAIRLSLLVVSVPMGFVYLVSQRRVAVVALLIALAALAVLLFWRQRRTFLRVVPAAALVGTLYVGAFWNSESSLAFPAQAVKTAVVAEGVNDADSSSNLYRKIENFNLVYTIRAAPLTGIGFGHAFYRPIPLADISFFVFSAYIPHNSMLWIWVKTGFVGFVAVLYLLARTLLLGMARARDAASGLPAHLTAGALAFVLMYAVYLWVDVAWEPRNVFLLAVAAALCTAPVAGLDEGSPGMDPDQIGGQPGRTPGVVPGGGSSTSRRGTVTDL